MKLLVDMNLSPRWIDMLVRSNIQAVHWSSIGDVKATDGEIMVRALADDYVVLTNDLDFSAILAVTHGSKPSVVQIRAENLSPDAIGSQVLIALRQLREELFTGALVTVEPDSMRVRLLPISRTR